MPHIRGLNQVRRINIIFITDNFGTTTIAFNLKSPSFKITLFPQTYHSGENKFIGHKEQLEAILAQQ